MLEPITVTIPAAVREMSELPAMRVTAALPSMLMFVAYTEKAPAAVIAAAPPAESERFPAHLVA